MEEGMLGPEARRVIESNALAHVVTLDPDGRPHVTLAWAGLEGDQIVTATLPDQRKLKNLRRDPRVALSFETDRMNDFGLTEYLVVHGRAEVVSGGAPELLQKLAHVYLGPDVKFPPMPDPPPGFVTRITVERLSGVGPWSS
jgi:PPOX class probable F420-dependent enzyme